MSATILRNCTVFDGHSDEAIPGQDVLVENDRIVVISPNQSGQPQRPWWT